MRQFTTALLVATALAGISAQAASAADIPVRAPVYTKAAPYLPYNWTGLYAGVNVGYGWAKLDGTGTLGALSNSGSETLTGIIGGGQFGYNWQASNNIVFGIETDIQASGESKTTNRTYFGLPFNGTAKATYFGTVRGRLGYAFDRWMPYVTGGFGYGEATVDATLGTIRTFSHSESKGVWVVGGGVETALVGNWTAKLEYLLLGADVTNTFNTTSGPLTVNNTVRNNILRVGLNYRL